MSAASSLQNLITMALVNYLRRNEDHGLALQVSPILGENNEHLPRFIVTGLLSGERVVVEVNKVDPE